MFLPNVGVVAIVFSADAVLHKVCRGVSSATDARPHDQGITLSGSAPDDEACVQGNMLVSLDYQQSLHGVMAIRYRAAYILVLRHPVPVQHSL